MDSHLLNLSDQQIGQDVDMVFGSQGLQLEEMDVNVWWLKPFVSIWSRGIQNPLLGIGSFKTAKDRWCTILYSFTQSPESTVVDIVLCSFKTEHHLDPNWWQCEEMKQTDNDRHLTLVCHFEQMEFVGDSIVCTLSTASKELLQSHARSSHHCMHLYD